MIYIFIICIVLLLLICIFSQQTIKSNVIKESFSNDIELPQEEIQEEVQVNTNMGKEFKREIKDSTFNTFMPSQITYKIFYHSLMQK